MRDLIKLTCQDCKRDNYVTDKNKRTMTEKFAIKKFCNACRKHTDTKKARSPRAEGTAGGVRCRLRYPRRRTLDLDRCVNRERRSRRRLGCTAPRYRRLRG